MYQGRTRGDVPGVDGLVFFSSERELMSGDFVQVKITESSVYDLAGEEVQDNEPE